MATEQIEIFYRVSDPGAGEFLGILNNHVERELPRVSVGSTTEIGVALDEEGRTVVVERERSIGRTALMPTDADGRFKIHLALVSSSRERGLMRAYSNMTTYRQKRARGGVEPEPLVPWGIKGLKSYLAENYPIRALTFSDFRLGSSKHLDRPVLLELDPSAESTEAFIEAQTVVMSALAKLCHPKRGDMIRANSFCRLGTLNARNTPETTLKAFESRMRFWLADEPQTWAVSEPEVRHQVS